MKETLRVLQVEDSESDAALIVRLLKNAGYDVHSQQVEDPEEMRSALERQDWDVVIADHSMARFDAPGALRILHETGRDIPFIVVPGSIGEELAVEMMKSGAHDYVLKDKLARLVPAVERELREARSRCERRQAERDLAESQERLTLAMQATQLGTFDFSPRTGKLIWSEMTNRHFGLPPGAEVSYDTFLCGLHPDDRARVDATVQSLLLPGSDGMYGIEYRTIGIEDRVERRVSAWGRVYFDPHGQAVRFVGVTLDISERKRLEDQLRQAQKLESLGRLAGGVAHDFNNLLTVINGYSELALTELPEHDPARALVGEIHRAGERAASLTRQLLAFSRKQMVHPKPLILNALVTETRKMLERLVGDNVEIVTILDPALGWIVADAGQINQVLVNLVVNARDAMPRGGAITIRTANVEETDSILLSVSDTGTGMDEATRQHIFEPFFTTKGQGQGTGLGLATVHGIVSQFGGSIEVESEPGRGTTFHIVWPRVKGVPEPEADPAEVRRGSASCGAETILVVEDNENVRRLTVDTLKIQGYEVLEAACGEEAMAMVGGHAGTIHLLLSDLVMPRMMGDELVLRVRALRPEIRVMLMSAYAEHVIDTGRLGPDFSFIAKPFSTRELRRKVREQLDAENPQGKACSASELLILRNLS